MRLINNIVSFAKKYKILILICIIVYISFYYLNIKEGFNATSCTQFANCAVFRNFSREPRSLENEQSKKPEEH